MKEKRAGKIIIAGILAAGLSAAVFATGSNPVRFPVQEKVVPENQDRNRLVLEAMEKLTPDTGRAAYPVTFAVRDFDFETDAVYQADDSALKGMVSWQLQILDSSGRKVHFIQSRGRPSSAIMPWSGLSGGGKPFPGGFYSARFVWMDSAGQVHVTPRTTFHLFTPLATPKFAELKLNLAFIGK